MGLIEPCPEWKRRIQMSIAVASVGVLLFAVTLAHTFLGVASQIVRLQLKRAVKTGLLEPDYAADLQGAMVDSRRLLYVSIAAVVIGAASSVIMVTAVAFEDTIDDGGKTGVLVLGLLILWGLGWVWMRIAIRWLVDAEAERFNAREIISGLQPTAAVGS